MTPAEFNQIALDPARSVVVEACAGSGKTWLLVSRMVRLLLDGVPPSEILAITFTRKAAREMRARLDDWLRLLATADDATVRKFLAERALPEPVIEALLPRARGLFEAVLTAQPGMTISTFHAWFLEVIQRAPLEAGLAGFGLAEQTRILERDAWDALTDELARQPESVAALAMQRLLADIGLGNTRKLLGAFLARRSEWWAYTEGQPDRVGYAMAQLAAVMPVAPDADVAGELLDDAGFMAELREYLGLLGKHTATSIKTAQAAQAALSDAAPAATRLDGLSAAILTKAGEIRKTVSYNPSQAGKMGEAPLIRLVGLHQQIGARIKAAQAARCAQQLYRFNELALRLGDALLDQYQTLKRARRVLDFADVEWQVARLLSDSDQAEYLQFKLDAHYRHILLDEFQDTNPVQWRVLRAWFEAAESADRMPTVFLVGDPKQSIYRFRGAEAGLFDLAGKYLARRGAAGLSQNQTRRSSPKVIQVVNETFLRVCEDYNLFAAHSVHDPHRPGRVEVLPLAQTAEPAASAPGYRNPLITPYADSEAQARAVEASQLAQRLNQIIGHWVIEDEKTGARRAEYCDVMILVRSRTHLPVYERALKAARIPFVTTRRGGLLDSLEVGDLMALLSFLVAPYADLHLARVLRSPLFDCTDGDLLTLAAGQAGSWWQRLEALATDAAASPTLARAARMLAGWLALAGQLPVHDLLDRIYFEGEVAARYHAAVPDALRGGVNANLAAFMELALNIDAGRYPSLPRFLHDLDQLQQGGAEDAPDEGESLDAGNAVVIHTVHGCKGLEAPIVWLLDAGPRQPRAGSYDVILDWPPDAPRPLHFSVYGDSALRGAFQTRHLEAESVHARRENFNLLYVAMTRARQALIVSGAAPRRGSHSGDWHGLILAAMGAEPEAGSAALGDDLTALPLAAAGCTPQREPEAVAIPPGLGQPCPTGSRVAPAQTAETGYGVLLHRILERIAPPAPMPDKVTLHALLGAPAGFDAAWEHARRLIAAPSLARFFDPGLYRFARNELPYLTAHGEARRIDRVVGFDDAIWVLDYKSGAEASNARLAARHRAQLQDYRAAMAQLWPAMPVRCAVVAADGRLIEIGAENSD